MSEPSMTRRHADDEFVDSPTVEVDDDDDDDDVEHFWQVREIQLGALSGLLLLAGFLPGRSGQEGWVLGLSIAALAAGGATFVPGTLKRLVKGRIGVGLLMTIGAAGTTLLGQVLSWVGLVIAAAGFLATMAAQARMGSSWRIGVDATERTELVTTGAFALVRNAIFTAMLTAFAGLTLMVPTVMTLAALVSLFVAVELQVRVVEEPYLQRTHGPAYASYAAKVGRFLSRIGRLRPDTLDVRPASATQEGSTKEL